MSYSLLGTSCIPHTLACTSNHKFLPLHDPVYKKRYTYMMQYPGRDVITDNISRIIPKHDIRYHPEILKSYNRKTLKHELPLNKSCKNC